MRYGRSVARSPATSTAFSRRVVRAVEQLRDQRRLSNTELIRAAGFSANYFYIRLRGEAPFNTNDIEKLANALDVDPHEVLELAESPALGAGNDAERLERLDGAELARRLTFLAEGPTGPDARTLVVDDLVTFMTAHSVAFMAEDWPALLSHPGTIRLPAGLLDALAEYFSVDFRYLRSTRDSDLAQLVEAEISLHRALIETGATAVSARALGGMSATQLDAITRAIRSIDTSAKKGEQ